eukprot:scaffold3163_cov60-Attheya_sp.AAC.10
MEEYLERLRRVETVLATRQHQQLQQPQHSSPSAAQLLSSRRGIRRIEGKEGSIQQNDIITSLDLILQQRTHHQEQQHMQQMQQMQQMAVMAYKQRLLNVLQLQASTTLPNRSANPSAIELLMSRDLENSGSYSNSILRRIQMTSPLGASLVNAPEISTFTASSPDLTSFLVGSQSRMNRNIMTSVLASDDTNRAWAHAAGLSTMITVAAEQNAAAGASLANTKTKKMRPAGKKKHPKKPKDMPRRPLSAYNIFFRDTRNTILQSLSAPQNLDGNKEQDLKNTKALDTEDEKSSSGRNRPHGKIGFENLAKIIGKQWKESESSEEIRSQYKTLAKRDMLRYETEMKEYKAKGLEKEARKERCITPRSLTDHEGSNNDAEEERGSSPGLQKRNTEDRSNTHELLHAAKKAKIAGTDTLQEDAQLLVSAAVANMT